MSSLLKRLITGTLYVALIVVTILFTDWAFPLLCVAFGLLSLIEFDKLSRNVGNLSGVVNGFDLASAVVILATALFIPDMATWTAASAALAMLYVLIRMTMQLYLKSTSPIVDVAKSMLSLCWVVVPLLALELLFRIDRAITLSLFVMIWLNDTGAFCAGSLFGRHKLFERISPKKTWEGWIGGFVLTVAFGWFAPQIPGFDSYLSPVQSMIMGVLVSIAATYGDLAESLFKRALHAKDSGNILPGHGGILDRIDSLLFSAPVVAIFLLLTRYFLPY